MTDLNGRCFIKQGVSLVPADFHAEEILSEIKDGQEVVISIRLPRNPYHHRWFFALLNKVVSNSDRFHDEDELLSCLKVACGHTKPIQLLSGEIYRLPRSINFASMSQDAFQRFTKRALYVLGQMTGIDPESLIKEVDETQPPAQKKQRKAKADADQNTEAKD
jgi:Protein of unknown function (DUF1367)